MKSKPTLGATIALLALLAHSASAAVLVDYKMTANGDALTAAASTAPTTVAANVSAPSIVNQLGNTFTAFSGGSNNYNVGTDRVTIWGTATGSVTSYANAFTAGSYITFSITAAPGFEIELSSISFQASSASSNATSDRAFYLVTATSPAGFSSSSTVLSTDRTVGGTLPLQNATAINTVPKDYSADLTSLGAIASGDTQYFRLYLQTPTSNQGIAFDDIVINGTVSATAIPEPASFAALAGAAFLGLAALRRRRA